MLFLLPLDPGVEMVVSSRGMSKGAEQTKGPQVIPKAYLQFGGVQFGGQWKNVTSASAEGEASAFVAASRKFGPYSVAVGAAYKLGQLLGARNARTARPAGASSAGAVGPAASRLSPRSEGEPASITSGSATEKSFR